jgi:sulfotransferase family protein
VSVPARVIFLGGLGRSGTTLIERVLGELPGACALGEVVHLWQRDVRDDERCGCGEPFSACPFWTAVGTAAFGGWAGVDVDRIAALAAGVERTRFIPTLARRRLPDPAAGAVAEYTGYYARVYRAALQASGAGAVVDSSKHASLAFCLRWCPEVDLRVVHVVRDSRGVAYSWTKRVPRPETDGAQEMTRYSPARSALLWDAHNAAFGLLRRRGVPVLRLRYEAFLDDPAGAVRDIAAFADLPVDERDLKFLDGGVATLGPGHSAAGNPMRFATGPVAMRRDDAWRHALPAGQRRLVAALTAPLLAGYGYRLSGRAR